MQLQRLRCSSSTSGPDFPIVHVLQTPPYEHALHGITMSRLIELIPEVSTAFFVARVCTSCHVVQPGGWDDDTPVIKHTIFRI